MLDDKSYKGCGKRAGKKLGEAMCEILKPYIKDSWQPIETAPKDGEYILAAHESGHVNIMQYCFDGCWRSNTNDIAKWNPTHWQPLPEPPQR